LHPRRPGKRSRPALALVVALFCLVTGGALVVLLGGPASEPARAQRAAQTPSDVLPGHEHAGDLGVPGMSENELRAFETATLGPEHAREHALVRRAIRQEKSGGSEPADDAGPKLAAAADVAADVGEPADVGQWEATKTPFPIVAIHAAQLPTGKIMFFSYPTYPIRPNNAQAYLWDPAHPELPPVLKNPPDMANIWCAGQTFTEDGELVVFGGNLAYESPSQTWKGLDRVFTFNPWTETWREQPKMAHGRWYPTGVRLPDGRIPIVSGLDESGLLDPNSHTNQDVELFTPANTLGGLGSIKKIGSIGTGDLAERTKKPIGQLYPRMVVMANGNTYLAGPDKETTWYFKDVDASPTFSWDDFPNMTRSRTWGTTVPLPSGPGGPTKLLAMGGTEWSGDGSTTTTELFDQNNPGSWQLQTGKDNLYGRGHANTVLLPDGSMVEVGGGRGSLDGFESPLHYAEPEKRHIELWDPDSGEWRLGPEQTEARAYHSTALLLPDGRVMSAGDDYNGDPGKVNANTDNDPMEDTAEIYKPPYLFRGPRPTITSVATTPATADPTSGAPIIGFNGSFGVNTPNTNITRAALAAPGAVTHGVDMNQRMLELNVVQRTGCVSVTAPTGRNAAPPGYYMLFLLNDQGVPSVAKFVKLEEGGPLGGCGTAPPPDLEAPTVTLLKPPAGTVAGTIDVEATASDDRGVVAVQFKRDGVLLTDDTTSPYTTTWNSTSVPDGTHTLTATARDAAGKTATASRTVTTENTDTDGPLVAITAPAGGVTVKGVAAVAANAGDPSGMSQVQFKVDGANIGPADASAPYSTWWDSINVPNGTHTLTAVARDSLGNERTSAGVSVNVENEDGVPVNALPPKKTPPTEAPPSGNPPTGNPPSGNPPATDLAPGLTKLKLSQPSFRKGKSTTISFRLSEAAKVTLSFERKLDGRRVHGKCVKPAKGKRANCTRYSRLRSVLTFQGKAGSNSFAFRGRLSRSKALAVGRYRLTLVATDASGKRSAGARVSFKLMESASAAQTRAVRSIVLGWL
jgi:galactose oxidase-like protein/Big-like domain-containing protein